MDVVSYERISEDKTGQAAGVDRQHRDNSLLAQAKGHSIGRRYVDNSISALDETKIRPEFEQLIRDVAAGHVGMIIVWHVDRLAVRMADLARLLTAARPHQVQIAAVHGISIDLGDPTGVAVAQILTAIAEMERRHKGTRQKAANRQRAENGRVGWTRRPFGYDRIDKQVVIVADEAAEYRLAADMVLNGATLASVVADLNTRGVTNSLGKPWTVTPLRRLLLNPRHAGRAVSNGKDYGDSDWPAIIDQDTHERLVQLLRDPNRRAAPSTTVKHLLSGLVRCGRCGERMFATTYGPKGRDRYLVYRCQAGRGHLVRKLDPVDEVVERVVLARLERPDAARLFVPDVDLDGLRARAIDLRSRRDTIAGMLADGLISADAAREQVQRLTAQLVDTTREIEHAMGSGPLVPLVSADDVRAVWAELPLVARRLVIDTLCTVAIQPLGKGRPFDPESVVITWRDSK
jgi:site-specific DNA recombinase